MKEYKMAKGAVKVSPRTEDVRLYAVVYQPDLNGEDYYPLGQGIWETPEDGDVIIDSYWADEELAEGRRRFIEESGGVGGFRIADDFYTRVWELNPSARDHYVLLEDK
jgi:hypothetical protein